MCGAASGPDATRSRRLPRKPRRKSTLTPTPAAIPTPTPAPEPSKRPEAPERRRFLTILAVVALLIAHYGMAARSLLGENPTVDEVAHLPAGVTYWQTGTFKLYHHNPPLFKLVAALPVVLSHPQMETLYQLRSWRSKSPSQATFSQLFAAANARRYFELFDLARLMMPIFTVIGGLAVFAWSSRLYGRLAGLLSLALWAFSPNILAHARLVTSDACSTALGVAATYVFWRYLHRPTWRWAIASGAMLGLAQLSKFSMLLLYAIWPFLWAAHGLIVERTRGTGLRPILTRGLVHGLAVVAISFLTIDAGYFFEGVGRPLGSFEFGSRTLTVPVAPGVARPHSENELLEAAWQFRVNFFRGTWLDRFPAPLPEHYLLGFDEQKIEAEGIPQRYFVAAELRKSRSPAEVAAYVDEHRRHPQTRNERTAGYTVYLDGELRDTGWHSYYVRAILYKVPEGTLLLFALSIAVLVAVRKALAGWFDELALLTIPVVILFSMTFLTDINLGLRYVLGVFPYFFIGIGKVVPWSLGLREPWRKVGGAIVGGALALTLTASVWIAPSYLAYFNWASGGPDREPVRLIDSNLDWGQDLVGLQRWWKAHIPDQPIGLAYFGQFTPSIFAMRGEPFDWFLAPARRGTVVSMSASPNANLIGPAPRLKAGYYAISATMLHGLRWRQYDPAPLERVPVAVQPLWSFENHAVDYFRQFQPMARIGHSILVYRLSEEDAALGNAELYRPPPRLNDSR